MPRQSDVRFTFEPAASGAAFEVVKFELREALSDCFVLAVELSSTNPAVDFGQLLDQSALFTIWRGETAVRYVHGVVSVFEQGDTGFRRTRYRVVIEPQLARTALRSDWRIFQQQSVPQITQTVLKRSDITDVEQNLTKDYLPREYCVQPGETDLRFFERLAAESGLYYAFTHSAQGHHLIQADRLYSHGVIGGGPVAYNPAPGGDQTQPCLRSFRYAENVRTARQTQRDYTFKHPRYNQQQVSTGINLDHQGRGYERYDYPGRFKRDEAGKPQTEARLLGLRRDAQEATVRGDDARLQPGLAFDLEGHPREDWNTGWRVVSMVHTGTQTTSQEEESAEATTGTYYGYEAQIIPDRIEWRPEPLPKPRIDGPQIATVVGPAGEEIFTDEYGRVKVQFPWDREGNNNEHSSCWIRVSQNWAGAGWGHMAIPRIGQEVIVDYLDGDCDQPVITGRTYPATNPPPYELPRHKTRMTIKSQTHKGEGYNELRFEDEAGQEEIFVHAQKDQNIHVNHDETHAIGNDQRVSVGHDRQTDIGQDEIHSTARDRKDHVGQDVFTTIDRNEVRKVGNTLQEDITASHHVTIGENETLVIEGTLSTEARTALRTLTRDGLLQAIVKLVLRGPNGSITLDQAGITLKSPVVRIDGRLVVNSPATDQVQAIESAIRQGLPVVEECPLAGKATS